MQAIVKMTGTDTDKLSTENEQGPRALLRETPLKETESHNHHSLRYIYFNIIFYFVLLFIKLLSTQGLFFVTFCGSLCVSLQVW